MSENKMMKEYILVFRMDITTEEAQPTPAQIEIYMKQWGEWTNSIEVQGKLLGGNHLSTEGRVLRANNVMIEGPYTEKKESMARYIIIKAVNLDDAVKIAMACPILQGEGTSVEVREIGVM